MDSTAGPSRMMAKLAPWTEEDVSMKTGIKSTTPKISEELLDQSFIDRFAKSFATKRACKSINAHLISSPFQVTTVENFLADKSYITKLVTEIEPLEWARKQMDLYEFYQTTDIANIQTRHLAQFYKFLSTDVKSWMELLTGMKFQKISASCSLYNSGDFLLAHDDLLSDRLIAFVFYLSPWEGIEKWDKTMGGALELFETDLNGQPKFPVAKKIHPSNNQFVFFKVEKKSYHQVGEVLTKDYPRLTINGWFHGFENNADYDDDAVKVKVPCMPLFKSPIDVIVNLRSLINKTYLKDSIKSSIQKQIEENSEAALGEFLIPDFHQRVAQELQGKDLKWIIKGPSNQRNYESLDTNNLRGNIAIKILVKAMSSKMMFKLMHEYTELDLHGAGAKKPKCTVDIQRWKGGCYTLIGDPSTYNSDTLDLLLYFGSNENVGTVTFLTPEGDPTDDISTTSSQSENEPVLLTIYPQNNFLNIVYRSSGTAKFTKYCPKSTVMQTEFNYLLICSYKE